MKIALADTCGMFQGRKSGGLALNGEGHLE
jgi:hypothetical protein